MLRARLLGPLAVEVDGRPLPPLPGLRPRSLLAHLLLAPGPHPRTRLAGAFWPDVLETSARASLRSALWSVRAALDAVGGGAYLAADRASAGIDPALPREVDLEEFRRLEASDDPADLERAVALGEGPLLADLADEWVLDARRAHGERVVAAVERLARLADERGDLDAAIRWTRRLLELDRLHEGAYRALMDRLARAGERARALEAYRRCRAVLAAELGVPPSAETRAMAERLRTGAPAADPPRPVPPPGPPSPRGPALVGRRAERAELRAAWRPRAGGAAVAVSGPAGIGKSRLLADLAEHAAGEGAIVLRGAGLDIDGAPPFSLWSEALRDLAARAPAPPPGTGWAADLARLCPAVEARWATVPPPAAASPDVERARLFDAVAEGLEWGARHAPLLVALEDVHRADGASLALLAYVARRADRLPGLVALTWRDAEAGPGLARVLDDLRRRGALRAEVALGPLPEDDLARLVAEAAPGIGSEGARRAAAAADGNPLVAREAARAIAAGREPAEGLRAWVRGPLARLEGPALVLVECAAAAARPLRADEAAALVGAEELAEAQAEAAASSLVEGAPGGGLRFAHDLVREACGAELEPARRARAHRRLADAILRRPRPEPAEAARHLVLAGDASAARAQLVAAAAEARRLGAVDEAAGFLAEAAGLGGEAPERAEILLLLAGCEAWRGRREAMEEAFAAAGSLLERAGEPVALATAHAERGRWLSTTVCYPSEARASFRCAAEILDACGADAPELRALALAGWAWAEAVDGDPGRARALAEEVRGAAAVGDDLALAAEIELAEATALMREGRFAEAEEPSARAGALAARAGRGELAHVAWVNLAAAAACRGDLEGALAFAGRAGVAGRGGPAMEAMALAARAHALSRLGRHDEAREAAAAELALAERADLADEEAAARFDLGAVLLAAGDPAAAAGHLRAALCGEARTVPRPLARLLLAEALLGAGDPGGAEEELTRMPFEPVGPGDLPQTLVPRLARTEGLLAAARGDPRLALRRLDEAERGWLALLGGLSAGEAYAANLVDLGRPPVAGLVEPARELERVRADRERVARAAASAVGEGDARVR